MGMVYIGVYLQTGCGERAKYLSILTFQIRCGSLWKRVWKLGQWHSMHGILRLRLCICIFYCSRSRICEVHIHTNIYIYMYISPTTVWASFLRHFFGLSSVFLWLFLLRLAFFVVNIMILPDWLVRFSLVWFLGLNLTWLAYFCGYYSILFFFTFVPERASMLRRQVANGTLKAGPWGV